MCQLPSALRVSETLRVSQPVKCRAQNPQIGPASRGAPNKQPNKLPSKTRLRKQKYLQSTNKKKENVYVYIYVQSANKKNGKDIYQFSKLLI